MWPTDGHSRRRQTQCTVGLAIALAPHTGASIVVKGADLQMSDVALLPSTAVFRCVHAAINIVERLVRQHLASVS